MKPFRKDFDTPQQVGAYKTASKLRARCLGYRCEVCGKKPPYVVHHVYKRGRGRNHWSQLTLRCPQCEKELHRLYPGSGNSPETLELQEYNNWRIRWRRSYQRLIRMGFDSPTVLSLIGPKPESRRIELRLAA